MRNVGPPMTLRNMRENGPRAVTARCEACGHQADVNVDAPPESVHVPDAGLSPLQPLRRQARLNQARMAYRPPPRRPTTSGRGLSAHFS